MAVITTTVTTGQVGALKWKRTRITIDRYDRDVIDAIKDTPASLRDYDPVTRTWTITGYLCAQRFLSWAAGHGHQIIQTGAPACDGSD